MELNNTPEEYRDSNGDVDWDKYFNDEDENPQGFMVCKHGNSFGSGIFTEYEWFHTQVEADSDSNWYNRECEYDELDTNTWYSNVRAISYENFLYYED